MKPFSMFSSSVGNRARKKVFNDERRRLAEEIEESTGVVIHSDGKKISESGTVVERLPIVLSGFKSGNTYIIDAPKVDDGKGKTLAETNLKALQEVGAVQKAVAVVADTTASMTGVNSGMFTLLENMLQTPLLKVFCRHHSADLIQKAVFKTIFGETVFA